MDKILYAIAFIGLLLFSVFIFKITSYETIEAVPVVAATPTITPIPTQIPLSAEKLETIVNEWRISQGLQALIHSENLCRIAEIRLSEIKTNWSHDGFSADRFCSQECTIGENLARNFFSEEEILTAWIASPAHLAELQYTYTHSCVKLDKKEAVQIFGYF